MLNEVTIGQFFPTGSVVHKLDPRIKMLLSFIYMIILFLCKNIFTFLVNMVLATIIYKISKIPISVLKKNIKPILPMITLATVINIFFIDGDTLFSLFGIGITKQGIYTAIFIILRMICLIAGTALLTYTTSPIELTNALECVLKPLKIFNISSHELAMMLTIALRFIPTLLNETNRIIAAQKSRGACFDAPKLKERIKSYIPVVIPLFSSAFKRAGELALVMESRCYNGGSGRTKMKELKITSLDVVALFLTFVYIIGIYFTNKIKYGCILCF